MDKELVKLIDNIDNDSKVINENVVTDDEFYDDFFDESGNPKFVEKSGSISENNIPVVDSEGKFKDSQIRYITPEGAQPSSFIQPVGSVTGDPSEASLGSQNYYARVDHVHPLPGTIGTVASNEPKVMAVGSNKAVQWLPKGVSVDRANADNAGFWTGMFKEEVEGVNKSLYFRPPIFDGNMKLTGFGEYVKIFTGRNAVV